MPARKSPRSNPKKPTGLQHEVGKSGPFDSVQQELYLNLIRTAAVAGEAVHHCLRRHDLRETAYNVLRIVASHGDDGLPSQSIADDMVTRVPDITRLVDGLVKQGLLERRRCPHDRRVVHVLITAAGRRKVKDVQKKVDAIHRSQFPGLTEAHMVKLIRLLERARESAPDSA